MTFTAALLPRRRFIWSRSRFVKWFGKILNLCRSLAARPTVPGQDYIYKLGISPGEHCLTQTLQMALVIKYQSKSAEYKVARRDLFADWLCKFDTRWESITMQIPGLHHAGAVIPASDWLTSHRAVFWLVNYKTNSRSSSCWEKSNALGWSV